MANRNKARTSPPPDMPDSGLLRVPKDNGRQIGYEGLDLVQLLQRIWNYRWLTLLAMCGGVIVAVVYIVFATEWYRASVLLMPADDDSVSALSGQFGGLAALAGVNVGDRDSQEAIATIESREFARDFIQANSLSTEFFGNANQDSASNQQAPELREEPDLRDAVDYLHDKVLEVREDSKSSLVTVTIKWTDPALAAAWANDIVSRLNDKLRLRALRESEENVAYLREQLASTNIVTLQQSIGRLLENELQKLMLARGTEEYAFRVIDGAVVPSRPDWPKPVLIVAIGLAVGLLSAFFVTAIIGMRAGLRF
ncbi:Wzz/FepE/Etk N-terminal domain-containing protein [Lentisalinibacter sediminis]|uniref:Wzz/FepE/Etk N-terminal domain-containing protein n=1 Tax=Lentisalinibacter sediminis TaxID=2992237 RepID=UPI00386C2745